MTYSELTPIERELLDFVHEAEKSDVEAYIMTMSILYCHNRPKDTSYMGNYSKGTFKRAVKRLREVQQQDPQHSSVYDGAIAYIRREWLHKGAAKMYSQLTPENRQIVDTKIDELLEQQTREGETNWERG